MSRSRRVIASLGAVTLLLVIPVASHAATPADQAVAADAVAWIGTQQQPDGGFEVAGFPGFETRDASLAIAEQAQTGASWSASEATDALAALEFGGAGGPTPLDALDAYAASLVPGGQPTSQAGAAAKTIALSAQPLGLDPAAFDAAGDGSPVDLTALLDGECDLLTFSDVLWGMIAGVTVCDTAPDEAVSAVVAAQQADGGWAFNGDPTASGFDGDTTGLAVQALIAAGVEGDAPVITAALRLAALDHAPDGGWFDFFGTASNPSTTAIVAIGIAAAGFDPTVACWRDTVAPELAGAAYVDPIAWLRSQQAPDGHITSPYDEFGVNTLTTSQSVHAILMNWFPVSPSAAQTCEVPPPPPDVVPATPITAVTPRFTG